MSLQSPQSQENDRLLEICKNVSNEQNAEKLTKLIHQLNDELDYRRSAKKPPQATIDANPHRASQG